MNDHDTDGAPSGGEYGDAWSGVVDPAPAGPAAPDPGIDPLDAWFTASDDTDEVPAGGGLNDSLRTVLEWIAVAAGALAVALLIKTFLIQAFYIPSGSMRETLVEGDRVLVNKLSYRLHDVNRGDVVVFEKPPGEVTDGIEDLIKRVVALPGETITFANGQVFIDGALLDEPYLAPDMATLAKAPIPNCDNAPVRDTCIVPEGRVFVMGDNREESRDARFFGPIEVDTIIGRAFLKVWPINDIGFL